MRVLAINPGSTSTKIAVFENLKNIFSVNIKHSNSQLEQFKKITDQYHFRKETILQELKQAGIGLETINAIVARGGLVKPIPSGVYLVNSALKQDLHKGILGEHASNLGGLIASDLAENLSGVNAYIADPVVVDELQDVARVSGHPAFERISIFHALNQKAVARTYAKKINKAYSDLNLIVAHLGGGISVGAHCRGKVIDVNQALNGEGPFSPERSGTLPAWELAKFCFRPDVTALQVKEMITGKGGFVAYLGTNDAYEVEMLVRNGDKKAKLIQDAMAYQIAKEIGSLSAVLKGSIDAIILTGGLAKNQLLIDYISSMVSFLAPVEIFPGEDEMSALALNGFLVLNNEVEIKYYV
jgi:butyrate kinase